MATSTLRHVWPFLGPILAALAIPAGYLAQQVCEWLPKAVETGHGVVASPAPISSQARVRKLAANREPSAEEVRLLKLLAGVREVGLVDGLDPEDQLEFVEELARIRRGDHERSNDAEQPEPLMAQELAWQGLGLLVPTRDCRLEPEAAQVLQDLAVSVRRHRLISLPGRDGRMEPPRQHTSDLVGMAGYAPTSKAPGLIQLFQVEGEPTRLDLLEALNRVPGILAVHALARRAVFDLSPKVRARAIELLAGKTRDQYRPVLLEGFRHPWAPAAEHAADALITLKDRDAISDLQNFLEEPDPSTPVGRDGTPMIRELVRVNHLKNCLLCHALADPRGGFLLGRVPRPEQPLPSGVKYYEDHERARDDIFVRADVTYLRQDFSVMLPVKDAAPWPEMQRFDFLVRTRPATAEERAAMESTGKRSPQREAILRALAGIK